MRMTVCKVTIALIQDSQALYKRRKYSRPDGNEILTKDRKGLTYTLLDT